MTYYAKITINETEYIDIDYARIKKGMNNKSGTFNLILNNQNAKYTETFDVGNEIKLYLDSNPIPTTLIFGGIIDEIEYDSQGGQVENITLSGRDYSCLLQDVTVLDTYLNKEISVILKEIIPIYAADLTTTNIDVTPQTLASITYKHRPLFDVFKELSEMVGFDFWVDENKNIYFKAQSTTSSGLILNNTNVIGQVRFRVDRENLYNDVWVYGGGTYIGWQDSFISEGVAITGSTFTLDYKPSNPYVTVAGTKKMGGILNFVNSLPSGTQYLIDYDNRKLIFVSGTSTGDNIPASGATVICQYDRSRPIVKNAFDQASINDYKRRTRIIQTNEIKDPLVAVEIANSQLLIDKDPKSMGDLRLKGINYIAIGNTIIIDLPNDDINNETFRIIETNYDITKQNLLNEEVLSIRVSNKLKDITDILSDLMLSVRKLQAQGFDPADVITKLLNGAGSFSADTYSWTLKSRLAVSGARWDHAYWDDAGSNYLWDASGVVGAWETKSSGGRWV